MKVRKRTLVVLALIIFSVLFIGPEGGRWFTPSNKPTLAILLALTITLILTYKK